MDLHLTDLDALCLTVRHPLTRSYIDESIKAYRAGCYKAAIVSIWIAVTFDIIAKIRDLADQGDPAAGAFVAMFDNNVRGNNTKKLLEVESGILDKAEKDFGFIDPITRRHFERLQQDRHLCAHPAFTADGQLFVPEPELARLYLVEAIRNLLSQRPVQGKTIINEFDRDFISLSFPATPEEVTRFVESRYLVNSRAGVHVPFANVLAKAILKQTPQGWHTKVSLLAPALQAFKNRDSSAWTTNILPAIVNLIETADDEYLPNAYSLLKRFYDLRASLSGPAKSRLLAFIQNVPIDTLDVRPFEAAALPDFDLAARDKFAAANPAIQEAVLARFPFRAFWDAARSRFSKVKSYRDAESLFARLIMPFRDSADPGQLSELLESVAANDQIFYASGIPSRLASFADSVGQRHMLHARHLTAFLTYLDDQRHSGRDFFSGVLDAFRASGVVIPPAPNK